MLEVWRIEIFKYYINLLNKVFQIEMQDQKIYFNNIFKRDLVHAFNLLLVSLSSEVQFSFFCKNECNQSVCFSYVNNRNEEVKEQKSVVWHQF